VYFYLKVYLMVNLFRYGFLWLIVYLRMKLDNDNVIYHDLVCYPLYLKYMKCCLFMVNYVKKVIMLIVYMFKDDEYMYVECMRNCWCVHT